MYKSLSSILSNSYMNSEKVLMGKKKSKNIRLVRFSHKLCYLLCIVITFRCKIVILFQTTNLILYRLYI